MSGELVALLIVLGLSAILAWRARRPFDLRPLAMTFGGAPAEEPCWTEEVRGQDGLSYGRTGCHHALLQEMDARARRGELDSPA